MKTATFRIKSASWVVIECEATATDYFNYYYYLLKYNLTYSTCTRDESHINIYQLMASPQELEWFDEYALPRKMKKQIVNSYMVSRCIANKMNPGIPSEDSVFYKKLSKLTILLKQWPYNFACGPMYFPSNFHFNFVVLRSDYS
jgi:hypothetical protein